MVIKNLKFKIKSFKTKIFFFLLVVFTFNFAFLTLNFVFAQTPDQGRLDLTVSPPVIELTAKPGEKLEEKFRVRNNLSQDIELQISARRLISDPTNGNPIPESEVKGEELKWVSFKNSTFLARPSEWVDVNFTINLPETAAYGYYYVFRITPKDEKALTTTGTTIKGEILVVALLNVKKDGAISKIELVDFKPNNSITEYLPAEFKVKLRNKGNIHVKPRGNIFISRGGGKELAILEVNPGIGSILPGGTREFSALWEDGFLVRMPVIENENIKLDKEGKPVTKLAINWNNLTNFRVGPYTAQLLMVYDDGARDLTIEGKTTLWVIPYTALAVILGGLVILFFVLRFILRWYIRRAIARSKNR